jgi:ribosomal protein L29
MSFKDAETKPLRPDMVREFDVLTLKEELARMRDATFRLNFRAATEDVTHDNPMRFRTLRRNIARVKTIIAEKERS